MKRNDLAESNGDDTLRGGAVEEKQKKRPTS